MASDPLHWKLIMVAVRLQTDIFMVVKEQPSRLPMRWTFKFTRLTRWQICFVGCVSITKQSVKARISVSMDLTCRDMTQIMSI